ncbi:gliding motility-associated C-terminal domain-containing protein, partial [Bacteroidota bacterium]
AIAVEVRSYRNSQLLTVVRRDIELIVLNCPVNYLPKLAITGGITTFVVDEGNSLSFDIPYTDKDSMYLTATGDLFGTSGSVPSPHATLTPAAGKDTIKSTFTWNTSCEHGRYTPYFFTVTVKDNGCPYKSTITIFQIFVTPFEGLDSISGPKDVCEFDDSVTYTAYGLSPGSLINWTITGGTILSGLGTDRVNVRWGSTGIGSVKVYETSKYGCGPLIKSKTVNIHPIPVADAGQSITVCSGDTIIIGDSLADLDNRYLWHTAKYLDDSTSNAPKFSTINQTGNPVLYKYYLQVTSVNNCISTDSIVITVYPEPNTSAINGPVTPCFLGTFSYFVSNTANSEYYWDIIGGNNMTGGFGNIIDILWTDSLSGEVRVFEVNKYNCIGDTQRMLVDIIRPDATIFGPDVVCPNTINVEYWVKNNPGSKYDWFVINGIRSDQNGTGPVIKVNWPDSGMAMIKVVETTKEGCISDTFFFPVLISYRLKTSDISGDTFVCAWTDGEPYYVMNVNGSTYSWYIDGGFIINGNGTSRILTDWGVDGMAWLKVFETSYDSVNDKYCYGDTVFQPVIINPIPVTSPINGRKDVCEFDTIVYQVAGFPGSSYHWEISDTSILFSGQGSDQIEVYWQTQGIFNLNVRELTKDSCGGDLIDTVIAVHPNPLTSAIKGNNFICFPNNNGIAYSVTGFGGSYFNWNADGGDIADSNGNPEVHINWTTVNTGILDVQEVTEWGCIGPVITKSIQVDSLAPVMELVTTRQENDLELKLYWDIINDYHLERKVALYKNAPASSNWIFVDSFDPAVRFYIDNLVKTHDYSYKYRIGVENLCTEIFYSHPHNSILLDGDKITDFDLNLHWTEYLNWPQGVNRYELYRRVNSESVYKLVENVNDTLYQFEAGLNGIVQCYRVSAVREGQEFTRSWSNEKCFEFEPVLQVPNAFTPNGDGLNDSFKVVYANIAYFEMNVYNRWGQLIYQTDNPDRGWNGTYEGEDCPLDVYVVVIKYQGNTPLKVYTGNITLIR